MHCACTPATAAATRSWRRAHATRVRGNARRRVRPRVPLLRSRRLVGQIAKLAALDHAVYDLAADQITGRIEWEGAGHAAQVARGVPSRGHARAAQAARPLHRIRQHVHGVIAEGRRWIGIHSVPLMELLDEATDFGRRHIRMEDGRNHGPFGGLAAAFDERGRAHGITAEYRDRYARGPYAGDEPTGKRDLTGQEDRVELEALPAFHHHIEPALNHDLVRIIRLA